MLIELTLGGVQYAGAVEPVTGPILNTTPIPTPIPTPTPYTPPAPAPAGTWPLNEVQLWPVPPLRGAVISVPFIADAVRYPDGVQVQGIDESQGLAKDYVISDINGSFIPLDGNENAAKRGAGSIMGPIYLRFGPARPRTFFGTTTLPTLDVALTPGQVYWINVRATDGSGAEVSTQFVAYKRRD